MDNNRTLKNINISNAYYNIALDMIEAKNLYMASMYLKKSLFFDKKNIDSRNLLGLIFYEEGEVVEALKMWVISVNFDNTELNLAHNYILHTQNDSASNDLYESIKNYNLAIDDLDNDRKDLAMHHLYKAISLNKHYVKALTLLALIQLSIKDHIKAGTTLLKIQKIDEGNPFINRLMNYTLKNTGKKEIIEKKLNNVYSSKKILEDDTILQDKVIKLTTNEKVLFLICGIGIGLIAYKMIIAPMTIQRLNNQSINSVVKYMDKIDDQNKLIKDLEDENNKLNADYKTVRERLDNYENQSNTFRIQYESLNDTIRQYDNGNIRSAIKSYVEVDKSSITDETLLLLLQEARNRIEGMGAEKICSLGTESWNAGDKESAEMIYKLALTLDPNNPEYMFLLGRLYQSMGKTDESNELFDNIISRFPTSNYARRARDARNY